jgi:hypothetical protein
MASIIINLQEGAKVHKREIRIPDAWNAVPANVYPELCSIYLKKDHEMSDYDKAVRAFVLLSLDSYDLVEKLQADELYPMLGTVDWVFNKLDLTQNLQPVVEIDGVQFHGPADEMENLRFAEWCVADTHFVNYSKSGNVQDLQQLAACIYRPIGSGDEFCRTSSHYRGDQREKFNDQLLKSRALLMAKLPKAILDGIYVFYASCKHQITGLYPEVFPVKQKGTTNSSDSVDQQFSWFDVYDDLRGDPKFGGPDKLEDEFLHTVLASIERTRTTMKKLKKQHKL